MKELIKRLLLHVLTLCAVVGVVWLSLRYPYFGLAFWTFTVKWFMDA